MIMISVMSGFCQLLFCGLAHSIQDIFPIYSGSTKKLWMFDFLDSFGKRGCEVCEVRVM